MEAMLCLLGGIAFMTIIMLASAIRIVPEHQRMAVYRLGRFIGEQGPGIIFLIPVIDRGITVDINDDMEKVQSYQNSFGVLGETKTYVHDNGEVEIDGKIWDAISSEAIRPGTRVRVKRVIFEIESF